VDKRALLYTVHDRPLYLACPDVLSTEGETPYGIRAGFMESEMVCTIYLFIDFLPRCKVFSCPVGQIKILK
jgi:hypothetical protein